MSRWRGANSSDSFLVTASACGDCSSNRLTLMTPIFSAACALATPENITATARTAAGKNFEPIIFNPSPLEGVTDGELEALHLVAEIPIRWGVCVQRRCVAEAQQAKRRQPLHAEPYGFLQPIILETVVDRVAELVIKIHAAAREDAADVVEQRDTGRPRDLSRRGNDELDLVGHDHVAAVRIAETVARAEVALLEAAHRARAATETIAERR